MKYSVHSPFPKTMDETDIIFTNDAGSSLLSMLEKHHPDRCFIIVPESLRQTLIFGLNAHTVTDNAHIIQIAEGETHKTLSAAESIWQHLLTHGATRHSLIINLGGGLTTDLGGYVAACYMRGIRYINIPTTILACVDAACGGKTAVNLDQVKNIIGAFHSPVATIISPQFISTLPQDELMSGWAEMFKHALLSGLEPTTRYLTYEPQALSEAQWITLIEESVRYKQRITSIDPHEKGLRRILNLGHTAGHALEALSHSGKDNLSPISHGHAVAIGLVTALVLSHLKVGFESMLLQRIAGKIKYWYRAFPFQCLHYDYLMELMHHDKKNIGNTGINFVLLASPGCPHEAVEISDDDIRNALDITRDLLGI